MNSVSAFRHYIDHSYHLPAPPILESIEALNSENNYSFGPTHSANNEAFSQSLDFAHIASPPRVDKMMADEDENVENDCGRSRTTFAPDFTLPPVITMEGAVECGGYEKMISQGLICLYFIGCDTRPFCTLNCG